MEKLIHELQRLYFLPGQQLHLDAPEAQGNLTTPQLLAKSLGGEVAPVLDLLSAAGMVRTLAIGFARSVEWARVASLYAAVQTDLTLPAPALSIAARGGYQLWFSLAEAMPLAQAHAFLDGLRLRYLADLPAAQLSVHPAPHAAAEASLLDLVPASHAASGRWSAFIDPSLGSMFADEAGLEMAPSLDGQADILAKVGSIKADDFLRALDSLGAGPAPGSQAAAAETRAGNAASAAHGRLNLGSDFRDPKSFLLAVMNDPTASAEQRIEAAKALLPYFASTEKK